MPGHLLADRGNRPIEPSGDHSQRFPATSPRDISSRSPNLNTLGERLLGTGAIPPEPSRTRWILPRCGLSASQLARQPDTERVCTKASGIRGLRSSDLLIQDRSENGARSVCVSLISRTRAIWVSRRTTSRRLPPATVVRPDRNRSTPASRSPSVEPHAQFARRAKHGDAGGNCGEGLWQNRALRSGWPAVSKNNTFRNLFLATIGTRMCIPPSARPLTRRFAKIGTVKILGEAGYHSFK